MEKPQHRNSLSFAIFAYYIGNNTLCLNLVIIIKQSISICILTKFSQSEVDELNSTIKTAEEALQWASDNLHPKVAKASSFGAEDAAIVDMMIKINPDFRFFTLDTGRLPQETYNVMADMKRKYNINLEILFPDTAEVEEMVREKGINLFYDSVENRKLCCQVRKVNPTNKILKTFDGWITGLRRDQTENRSNITMFQIDEQHDGILKINPIVDWNWDQVWNYIKEHNVPYNTLLDRGFPSIGCAPCTRAITLGEGRRSGRWWWEHSEKKECGLHIAPNTDKE